MVPRHDPNSSARSPGKGSCPFSAVVGQPVSRRHLLAGAAALAAAPLLISMDATSAAADPTPPPPGGPGVAAAGADGSPLPGFVNWKHAIGDPRGSDVVAKFGRRKEGRFGTMFKDLTAFAPDDALLVALSEAMVEKPSAPGDSLDNREMPSGFVYFGQFIDHDMTRDTTPLSAQREDPHGLTNFATPQFDLGALYGNGPHNNPELYDLDGQHLLLRPNTLGIMDLPRDSNDIAFLGDPRNDEHLIINQMHQAFIKLHNHFLDHDAQGDFTHAQQLTRWHYQWVIVHDFLPHLVGQHLLDDMIFTSGTRIRAKTRFYHPANPWRPMMPIEYSAAAYRWGHSAIRPWYVMHNSPLSPNPAALPIFNSDPDPAHAKDLRGLRPLYQDATIDWNYFFDIPGLNPPGQRNFARLIDTQLARPLHDLPDSVVAHVPGAILALAQRDLLRGKRLGLPAGQDIAARMQQLLPSMPAPLTNTQLDPTGRFGLANPGWSGKSPLWFYCLREAELGGGHKLGPVGGRLCAEVILGLLQLDSQSYWNAPTPFTPVSPNFTMGQLLKLAGAPIINPDTQQPL